MTGRSTRTCPMKERTSPRRTAPRARSCSEPTPNAGWPAARTGVCSGADRASWSGRSSSGSGSCAPSVERRITPFDPFTYTTKSQLSPSGDHWFGTDKIGRDIFSRVLAGARDVLLVAPPAAVLGVLLGTIVGMLMGYFRGKVDLVLSRVVEAFLSLPVILIGLLVLSLASTSDLLKAITFDSRKVLVIYVVAALFAPIVARTVRAAVIGERDLDYVTSARLRGESSMFIMTREIFPNILPPDHRRADRPHRICDLHRLDAHLPRASACNVRRPTGVSRSEMDETCCRPASGGRSPSLPWPSPHWSSGST